MTPPGRRSHRRIGRGRPGLFLTNCRLPTGTRAGDGPLAPRSTAADPTTIPHVDQHRPDLLVDPQGIGDNVPAFEHAHRRQTWHLVLHQEVCGIRWRSDQ
jgi:hypothetical protein